MGQVNERTVADQVRGQIDSAIAAVENRVYDAIENVVRPRVEMAVRSITGSSRHEPNSGVLNPDLRDISGYTEITLLMSTSGRVDLNIDQDRNDKTRSVENIEDGNFSAVLRRNYDRRAHTHHVDITILKTLFLSSNFTTKLLCCLSGISITQKNWPPLLQNALYRFEIP